MTRVFTKQPSEEKFYGVDFEDALDAGDSLASITSIAITPDDDDLELTGEAIAGTNVTFMLSGGVDGTVYTIEVIVTTTLGETLEGDGLLEVAELPIEATGLRHTYTSIMADVAQWLGWGRSGWDTDQEDSLESIILDGLRQFYWPPPLQGQPAHSWSFLKPIDEISTVIGQGDYNLPDDFGGLIGSVYYSPGDNVWTPIEDVGPGKLLSLRSRDLSDGKPRYACVTPQRSTGATPQKWMLSLVPAADAVYPLQYRYQVVPQEVSTYRPYHLGSPVHSRTLLQSCLAIAELRYRDGEQQQQQAFLQTLMASISHDRLLSPQKLGYNGDGAAYPRMRRDSYVTYNGVLYDNR